MLAVALGFWLMCALLGGLLNGGIGFVLGLIFGPLGVIAAGFLRTPETPATAPSTPPSHADERKCPDCAEWVKREAIKCRFCGAQLEPIAPPAAPVRAPKVIAETKCPHCDGKIPSDATRCVHCMKPVTPATDPSAFYNPVK